MEKLRIQGIRTVVFYQILLTIASSSLFNTSESFADDSSNILLFIPAIIRPGWSGFSQDYTAVPAVQNYGIVTDILHADLNKDDLQDLIFIRTTESPFYQKLYLQALINTGNKSFIDQTSTYFPNIGNEWDWIQKAYMVDLNNDGLDDIVGNSAKGFSNRTLPPLIRNANGVFSITADKALLNTPGGMVPIDIDSDQDVDILVYRDHNFGNPTTYRHEWTLLKNLNTSPGHTAFRSSGVVASSSRRGWDFTAFVDSPAVIDINNDGYDDFLYGGPKWKNNSFIDEKTPLYVYINTTKNTFQESSNTVFAGKVPHFAHTYQMVTGDFLNNGHQSVVVANTGYDGEPFPGERNVLLKNSGTGRLVEDKGTLSTHNYKGYTHAMAYGDIDNDGDLDIVYADIVGDDVLPNERIRILLNSGDGNFEPLHFQVDWTIGNWTAAKLVDLDNNGFPELVLGGMRKEHKSIIYWNY